jgi:hypothetical protein
MYLSSTDKIEVVLAGVITTNQLQCVASYQLITSAGVTLPESSTQQNTNSTTPIDLVTGAASTNTDVVEMTIFNADTVSATVTVTKDVSGSNFILVRALLQVGDTLMYGRNGQWSILSQSSQESVLLTAFTSSGTWTKPAGLKRVLVTCGGAGGGSGSGRQGAAGENRFGGAGGAGGAVVWRQIAASDLTSTVAVTIGAGGTAGAAPAGINTNGNAGGAGGDTSFGGLVIAKGGLGGNAGTTASGAAVTGGQSSACTPAYMPYSISGSSSGSGQTTTNSAGGIGFNGVIGCPGGGGGAGINNLNVSGTGANTGGGLWVNGIFTVGPVSGASPNGVDNVNRFLFFSNTISAPVGIGTAGGGWYSCVSARRNRGQVCGCGW